MILFKHTQNNESEVNTMGKMFTTSRVGNKVMANYDNSHMYDLSFKTEAEAEFFVSELAATQKDFWTNGRENAKRKKSMFANPTECTVSMNFNTTESDTKWTMTANLVSEAEAKAFYADVKYAIWGPMPS